MFRPQVLRRGFTSFSRLSNPRIVRSAARDGHDSIIIQRVRIRKPFWSRTFRLYWVFCLVGLTGFVVGDWLALKQQKEDVKDDKRNPNLPGNAVQSTRELGKGLTDSEVDDDEEEFEDDGALLFLPTGFSRPKPATYYRGSDPEWQEFVRIASDRKRMQKIRGELVTAIREFAIRNPAWVKALGKINPNEGGVWMEHKFPDGPPIEYERPGIELTEDLHWRRTTRTVEEAHHQRLGNLLYPSAVASPLYNDWRRRVGDSWNGFKSYMGWGGKSEPLTAQSIVQFPPLNPKSLARPALPPSTSSSKNPPDSSTAPTTDPGKSQVSSSSSPIPLHDRDISWLSTGVKSYCLDLSQFRREVQKSRKPPKKQPPRGSFLLFGIVEVKGERAKLSLDVVAAYDPKLNEFVTMSIAIRNFTEWRQRPKGGA